MLQGGNQVLLGPRVPVTGDKSGPPVCKPPLLPIPSKFPVGPLPQWAPSRTHQGALLAVRRGWQPRLTRLLCAFFPGLDGALGVKERTVRNAEQKQKASPSVKRCVCMYTRVLLCVHVWACALACG